MSSTPDFKHSWRLGIPPRAGRSPFRTSVTMVGPLGAAKCEVVW